MKKLLSMLAVITLIGTASTSVIACGGGQEPISPIINNGNSIQELLIKTQDKIKEGFGDLTNSNANLFFQDEFVSGKDYFNILKNLSSEKEVIIDNINFINAFTKRIQKIININITNKLILDNNLRLLFNGISNDDILKISTNRSNFKKVPFKWKKEEVNFGIQNYSPDKLNIEFWYSIKINLNLLLSYKDDNNKLQNKDLNQEYIIYFANTGANIFSVIQAASLEIKNKIEDYLVNIDITKDNHNIIDKAKEILLRILNNNKIVINESTFLEKNDVKIKKNLYNEANHFYNAFNKLRIDSINYLKEYFNIIVEDFKKDLDKWIDSNLSSTTKSKIEKDKSNIKNFGKISLNNWTISGLTLERINFNFITIRKNQTRQEWVNFVSQALGKIFSLDGFIKIPFSIINKENALIMYMDKTDFNSYVSENKSLFDVSNYFSEKIKEKAITEGVISNNTEFRILLNGCWKEDATLKNSEFIRNIDASTLEVIKNPLNYYSYLNITIDDFSFIFGNKKTRDNTNKNNYITFDKWIIKKSDSNIWN
ncbi:lipoprotein [Spiroplasma endosymbiont of Nomada ruficornis]|uniref:lipoprotein n=1 Tax=Spiroplasma endosymbiont of Nomada ruficornis TaxID=3066325 RepID=UPI00313E2245